LLINTISYTEEIIQDVFKDFIIKLFTFEEQFYKIIIDSFASDRFKEKFEKEVVFQKVC